MEWLNYHHLLYFWTVVRTGGVTKASEELRLAPPTVSAQLRSLEQQLGEKLLVRSGRKVVTTEVGRIVYRYAEEVFSLGQELLDTIKDRPTGLPLRLTIGIADVLPKEISHALIEPALHLSERVRIICREDNQEHLLAQLSIQELDVVLTDTPIGPPAKIRGYNHLLGDCPTTFFISRRCKYSPKTRQFPELLNGAPMLLPADNTTSRRELDHWLIEQRIRPSIVGEFEDFALMRRFAETGAGIIAAPSVLEKSFNSRNGYRVLGREAKIRNRFYAISVERRINNPAVVAICETARHTIFGAS
jgi:LysR family transcriptional regulator, transcriptional activator of nhaA